MRVRQADVLIEHTSTGALVCDPRLGVVHRLDQLHAQYLRTAVSTGTLPDDPVTHHLLTKQILHPHPPADAPPQPVEPQHPSQVGKPARPIPHRAVTRRTLLATAAATGITTLTLPAAAAASSTSSPAAPTSDLLMSADPSLRDLWVLWEPVPGPFSYTWSVFNMTSGKVLLATGTGSASYFDFKVYTVPTNVSTVRLEVSSLTTPAVSDFLETSF